VSAIGTKARRWTRAAAVTLAAGTVLPLLATAAAADPAGHQPASAAEAQSLVERTAQQLTVIDEQIQQAELTVAGEQKTAAQAAEKAAAAKKAVAAFEPELRAIAQSGLTSNSQSRVAAFLTSSSAAALVQQMTTLDVIAAHTEQVLAKVAAAQRVADRAKATADAAGARARASLATLQQQKKQLQSAATSYRAAFSRLTVGQQAAVTTAIAGPTLATPSLDSLPQAPNGTLALVIKTALAQVGKPYIYGSMGPTGFDCSGLTAFAFAAGGITLPHSSAAQSTMGVRVPRSQLRPGDLVFFYSPISHVGLYLGNGMMVHARTFGSPVAVTSVDMAGYNTAVRIVRGHQ
jgi:cell wall-associated NlpC family hydrolase